MPSGCSKSSTGNPERKDSPSAVVYVDVNNVSGPWDGKSWATAYQTIQEGLDDAERTGGEVWVAEGTYKPTSTTDQTISFQLKSGVALYGGFKGTETARDQRDWAKNITILSGDIGKPGDNNGNSYHVVKGADNATIDGFTITHGGTAERIAGPPMRPGHIRGESPLKWIADSPKDGTGGGMLNFLASPTVRNCTFMENSASKGGGVYNMCYPHEYFPTFINCVFRGNSAGVRGGGVANDLLTHPTFISCSFIDNHCDVKGGAMYNDFHCSPTLVNCLFVGNSAEGGGAMGNDGCSNPVFTNCTFTKNYAADLGGALYQGTTREDLPPPSPILTNCILWGDICPCGPKEIENWHECNPTVTHCDVEGGYRGEGNIDTDPLFVDPGGGDYHLRPESPCAGMGAYEWNGEMIAAECRGGPSREVLTAEAVNPASSGVLVDVDNTAGPWDGKSWATAFRTIQEGLDAAERTGAEVWVAEGTYYPTPTTDRTVSFQLKPGVTLYGGFKGNELARDQRDWLKNVTILSGDIGRQGDNSHSSYHVVKGAPYAAINGFTITGGNADGDAPYDRKGGGMINYDNASVTVMNCIFTGNSADEGGAIYNWNLSSPTLVNCTFSGNTARKNGGAIVNRNGCSPAVNNCTFTKNYAKLRGGAMFMDYGSNPILNNCAFAENSSDGHGGGMYTYNKASQIGVTRPVVTNCAFNGNSAKFRGGGMANYDGGNSIVTACIFTGNYAGKGGGAIANDKADVKVSKCTFKGNSAGEGDADVDNGEPFAMKPSHKQVKD